MSDVILTDQPDFDPLIEKLIEGEPELIDNVLYQTWLVITLSSRPTFNFLTQKAVEITPITIADVLTQQWEVRWLDTQERGLARITARNFNNEIKSNLLDVDNKRIRALSDIALGNGAVSTGSPSLTPVERLQAYETEAQALRDKIISLD